MDILLNFLKLFFSVGIIGIITSLFNKKIKKKPFILLTIISLVLLIILSTLFNFNTLLIFSEIYNYAIILALLGGIVGIITSLFNKKIKKKPFILLTIISLVLFIVTVMSNFLSPLTTI